jgi:flagellin
MSSILTNNSAMVALQTLKGINKNLGEVQGQISTGLKVATAKDNAASWAIAATMKSDVGSYKKLSEGLTSSSAMVGVARAASEQITDTLRLIQEKVVQAQDPSQDKAKIQADITKLSDTITSIANSAQFNGVNLVNSAAGTGDKTVVVGLTRSAGGAVTTETMNVASVNFAGLAAAINVNPTAPATGSTVDDVDALLDIAIGAASAFGSAQTRIDAQNDFLGKQMDAMKVGVGALVDADMEEASARLQALQVQQQLGTQSLSIANQAPQSVLSLFR